jgi:hypothetical protein
MWGSHKSYPLGLLILLLLRHPLPYSIWVPESPCGELLQDANFLKDIKSVEFYRLLVVSKRVSRRCFCVVLSARVFFKVIVTKENKAVQFAAGWLFG